MIKKFEHFENEEIPSELSNRPVNTFDFQDWENTDIEGPGMEIMIDEIITEALDRINKAVDSKMVGKDAYEIAKMKRLAAREIRMLWVRNINEYLKFK